MDAVFLKLLNMSITASWLILAVIAARFALKKAPKWMNCALWGLVGLRLLFPFSIESVFSLIPSAETVSPDIMYSQTPGITSGIPAINSVVNPVISGSFAPSPEASVNPLQIWAAVASYVWLIGIASMVIYAAVSYLLMRKKVKASIHLRDNMWICDDIQTPFILGVFKPRIYLPSGMDEETEAHVIAHENAHLKRRDHWWKPLGFLLLSVYWFNPVIWLAYILLCRDIELACDEKVIRGMEKSGMLAYSEALYSCSVPRRWVMVCPLAFGEVGMKERIKTVLNYKKPAFWIIAVAVVACVVVAVCFLTNPKSDYSPQEGDAQGVGVRIVNEISPKSDSITIEWVNSTAYEAVYGDAYDIQHLENGEWISCAIDEVVFHMPGYSLQAGGSVKKDYSLSNYNLTQPGEYRFIAKFHFTKDVPITEDESLMVWAAFKIEKISLDDVIKLSQKGEKLTWADFDSYPYIDAGSGLHIRVYEIDSQFSLWIGGGSLQAAPMYIRLVSEANRDDYIDIRTEDVEAFIADRLDSASTSTVGGADGPTQWIQTADNLSITLATEELLAQYHDYEEVYAAVDEYGQQLLMTTDETIYNLCIFPLAWDEESQTAVASINYLYYSTDEMTPDRPLVVTVSFPGVLPTVGVTYRDGNGEGRYYQIVMSGEDGSPLLVDAPVETTDAPLTICSAGSTVVPYQNFLWSHEWDGTGWLFADGMSVNYTLPKIAKELPTVTMSDNFEFIYGDNASFSYLSIFDESYDRIYHNVTLDRLIGLPAGLYYVSAVVKVQGEYIAEGKDYEATGYECVFKLIVPNVDPPEAAVSSAIMAHNYGEHFHGDFACESHVILASEGGGPASSGKIETVSVYAMVLYQEYSFSGATFHEVSGSHIPTALTFDIGEDGTYTLAEYWTPRDGSYYAPDICEKFPADIAEDAMDTQKYILGQIQNCYAQVVEYGKVDTNAVIGQLLDVITSSPASSSNPGDYIDAHPIEYRELTYYGDYTLRYVFSAFLIGDQTDLRGHIMRSVMDDLIGGEALNLEANNGQEYFDAWREHVERIYAQNDATYMQENCPKGWLLLQMID